MGNILQRKGKKRVKEEKEKKRGKRE